MDLVEQVAPIQLVELIELIQVLEVVEVVELENLAEVVEPIELAKLTEVVEVVELRCLLKQQNSNAEYVLVICKTFWKIESVNKDFLF